MKKKEMRRKKAWCHIREHKALHDVIWFSQHKRLLLPLGLSVNLSAGEQIGRESLGRLGSVTCATFADREVLPELLLTYAKCTF